MNFHNLHWYEPKQLTHVSSFAAKLRWPLPSWPVWLSSSFLFPPSFIHGSLWSGHPCGCTVRTSVEYSVARYPNSPRSRRMSRAYLHFECIHASTFSVVGWRKKKKNSATIVCHCGTNRLDIFFVTRLCYEATRCFLYINMIKSRRYNLPNSIFEIIREDWDSAWFHLEAPTGATLVWTETMLGFLSLYVGGFYFYLIFLNMATCQKLVELQFRGQTVLGISHSGISKTFQALRDVRNELGWTGWKSTEALKQVTLTNAKKVTCWQSTNQSNFPRSTSHTG